MGYHEHIWFHQCQEDINSFEILLTFDPFPEIFIFNCKEDYDHLNLACKPIFQKINTLCGKASIEVEGKHFDLDILMGGDMKCLQLSVITIKGNTTKFEILLTFDPSPEILIFILYVSGFT
jgi:hypothetical protein